MVRLRRTIMTWTGNSGPVIFDNWRSIHTSPKLPVRGNYGLLKTPQKGLIWHCFLVGAEKIPVRLFSYTRRIRASNGWSGGTILTFWRRAQEVIFDSADQSTSPRAARYYSWFSKLTAAQRAFAGGQFWPVSSNFTGVNFALFYEY